MRVVYTGECLFVHPAPRTTGHPRRRRPICSHVALPPQIIFGAVKRCEWLARTIWLLPPQLARLHLLAYDL